MSVVTQLAQTCNQQQVRPVLVVEDTKGKRIVNLDKNIYSLGRDYKNSLVIHSPLVSRHHATLLRVPNPENNNYLFQIIDGDLQGNYSTNGLSINGKRCLSHSLKHKDLIVFGAKAQAIYLVIDYNLSETDILAKCQNGDLSNLSHDAFETLILSDFPSEQVSDAALLRLASFPELLPIPIIEIDLLSTITYLNPAAILQFPYIQENHLNYSIVEGLVSAVQKEKKEFFVREIEIGSSIFEQSVHYIYESRTIRSYLVDISQRKQAEKYLKQVNEKLEIQVEERTSELRQSIQQLQAEIVERQQAEAMIRYQALHDLLTGLPNRTLFNEHLKVSLAHAAKNGTLLAVMFLDLDRFKTINDTLGHPIGDRLLQSFVERLTGCLRPGDTVARWGGDEFTVLLPYISSAEEAAKIAQRILDNLIPAFNLETNGTAGGIVSLHISSSIGIALYPHDGEDGETLLRNADVALYRAKEHGRNNYQFYIPAMNSQASTLLKLENRLYQALEHGEFILHYQPQVNINTLEIVGMEALLRWQHPELGLVPPGQFIPLAEETGLIVPIGEWVLRAACAQNKAWQDAGFSPVRMAINLSPRQFQQANLIALVAQVLSETGLAPEYLELEITETTVMQNVEFVSAMLYDFQKMGVHISMDDFGTGYSSLSYLKKFPFHTLKIDQSFVRELMDNPQDTAIISAVITLGRGLNLRVVAEGVETKEQLELLRSLQCEQMQGYLFSPPLRVEDATQFLQKYWF
ncbi:MAG: EAL domain-containing protein [Aphanothece sp. CMT-3BRIN-NPC111]|jgi:diguanylate cyclase (GGDEF)-like protein|nr:EAL domain-containing protein [Aphanothece sp. CMT-3BRIN-NPC111]